MKLSAKDYQEIRCWIYRNARPLELAIWRHDFEGGNHEDVLDALSFYQNGDGGFGHALEADNWNPDSLPYTTLAAINILKGIPFTDMRHPIMQGIIRFLESGAWCNENGWYFNIPSNNNHAHAPWWTYDEEANNVESIGVTAEIVGFLLTCADRNSQLYQKALALADRLIGRLNTPGRYGDMGVGGYCTLLDAIKQAKLTSHFDCIFISDKLTALVNESIVREPAEWVNYCVRPSNYIKSPESVFYRDNKDIVAKELDYLIDTRPENGVWGITWSWFDNNGKYAREFAISENWWKAVKAIEKVHFLRNFGRADEGLLQG